MTKRIIVLFVLCLVTLAGCHKGDFVFHGVQAESPVALPATEEPTTEPEVVLPGEDTGTDEDPVIVATPSCDVIKGNISTKDGRKLYHMPGMRNYNSVKIDTNKGEKFFCTEEEAKAAGWTKAGN